MELHALSEFQSLPSIGVRFAHDLISMGFYSLDELKKKDPVKLIHTLEKQVGAWADPCLEDQFRLVVHYAKNRNSKKNWWDFTPERKAYRQQYGYPKDRPAKAWYELEEYKIHNSIPAKSVTTKKEVTRKVKEAMAYIKKNYSEPITLKQLAKVAYLSPFHFQRSFKAAYEQSPLQFITHLRLKKACQLLKHSNIPIQDIVVKCGFENASSFVRLFKKRFQQTPVAYRSDHQNLSTR